MMLPTTSSSSMTSIRTVSTEAGHMKARCSLFQTGWLVLVSLLFWVSSTYSPIVTRIEQFIQPKVRVLRVNSAVSKRKFITSHFYYLKVAVRVTNPICFRSKLRKHLRFTCWGYLSTVCPGEDYGLLTCKALRQGSRSMMPQPISESEPMLLSMSSISRQRPQYLKQLLTMSLKISVKCGFLPPFLTTVPFLTWLESLTLTQGSMVKRLLVSLSMTASLSLTSSTPKTVSLFLLSFTPQGSELPQPIEVSYKQAIKLQSGLMAAPTVGTAVWKGDNGLFIDILCCWVMVSRGGGICLLQLWLVD